MIGNMPLLLDLLVVSFQEYCAEVILQCFGHAVSGLLSYVLISMDSFQ
jgi:hypothetical protein